VQAAWWGHPDTTGVPTIDFFVSSRWEVADADRHYSERLYRMNGLGTFFLQPGLDQDTQALAIKDSMREQLGLPRHFHLYLIPQALFKLHDDFDDVLVQILSKDRLAYIMLLNGRDRPVWAEELLARLRPKTKGESVERVLFYSVRGHDEMLAMYRASDVVLDPFPSGGFITSFEAFAMGTPVVTMPTQFIGGRLTYAMYDKMGISECVAASASEFTEIALRLAHNPAARATVVSRILSRNHRLFEDASAIEEWAMFLRHAVGKLI